MLIYPSTTLFWSDTHFGHSNIINYSNRPFRSMQDMHDRMNLEHRASAAHNPMIHLGDWIFRHHYEAAPHVAAYIEGHSHVLLLGNHDDWWYERPDLADLWFNKVIGTPKSWETNTLKIEIDNTPLLLSHAPQQDLQGCRYNIHGHVHTRSLPLPYINACVEATDYRPMSLADLLHVAMRREVQTLLEEEDIPQY